MRIGGRTVVKPSEMIDENTKPAVEISAGERYVSRGGLKLQAALEAFGIDVSGMIAVDIGASTGGFTDCLLSRGAAAVTAVDSGCGQLDGRLQNDPRVRSIEKFNARQLCDGEIDGIAPGADIVVLDVSFISQTYIIPGLANILREGGYYVGLIKPQFEAGRGAVGGGGIVRDKKHHTASILRVTDCAAAAGLRCLGVVASPIEGGDGNREYIAAYLLDGRAVPVTREYIEKIVCG